MLSPVISRMAALDWPGAIRRLPVERLCLLAGSALLALHPLRWLVGTWLDPAYGSAGLLVAGIAGALLLWSASSAPALLPGGAGSRVLAGLMATALVRLAAQVLAINVLGAAALAVDAYLVGRLLGLDGRHRAISPAWLAVTFAFSLPIERIVQRILGFALQLASADAACCVLTLAGIRVSCDGVNLNYGGASVLVDLPCSGANGLTIQLTLFAALAALRRPTLGAALVGAGATIAGAFAANTLRIATLVLGVGGAVDVFAEPWHTGIGVAALVFGALAPLGWAWHVRSRPLRCAPDRRSPNLPRGLALGFLAVAAVIILLPSRPVDVSHAVAAKPLPAILGGARAEPEALSVREVAYFTRYGGGAAHARYGANALLVVSTAAPLRHLHAPEECLEGAGHVVRYLGRAAGSLPSAVYQSTDPAGTSWRVAVSFVSDRGLVSASVAEVVWLWLRDPSSVWTMIERITPWDAPPAASEAFEAAVTAAFDLPHPSLHPSELSLGG